MSSMLSPSLRYFLEVVRSGSIRLAAERLHVAPSAISRQIVLLEREVGAPLLMRTARGVMPTEQGRLVATYGNRVGRGADRLRMSLDDLGQVRRGRVSLATVEGMLDRVLPDALLTFRSAYPGVTVSVQVAGTHQVVEAVLRESVEIGIAFETPRRGRIAAAAALGATPPCRHAPRAPACGPHQDQRGRSFVSSTRPPGRYLRNPHAGLTAPPPPPAVSPRQLPKQTRSTCAAAMRGPVRL